MGIICCKEDIDFSEEVQLNHFNMLRVVGKGAFGKVRMVQHKLDKEYYALKYINKDKCIRMKAIDNIVQERKILENLHFPLICNLRYAFQDEEHLFMVLDLMLGGDLRFHLERRGHFTEELVRFYAAEISLSIHHLHSRRIIHRDLKPDNLLLDLKGHCNITDFNIAIFCPEGKTLTSIAGSLAYMAPEILTKKGYTFSVDWWSMGVLLYEFLYGKRPFKAKTNEALTKSIIREHVPFPEISPSKEPISPEAISFIKELLTRDVNQRLGSCKQGFSRVMNHSWFNGLDWKSMAQKSCPAPFIPDSKKSNFDATHELEELLMEEAPLKVKRRNDTFHSTQSKELQVIEKQFKVYDYTKVPKVHPFVPNPSRSSTLTHVDSSDMTSRNSTPLYPILRSSQSNSRREHSPSKSRLSHLTVSD